MKSGIAFRLSVVLAVVVAVTAGVTTYSAYEGSRDLLVASTENELLTSTKVLARRILLSRAEIVRNLQILSRHPAARAALEGDDVTPRGQLADLFELVMDANPGYYQVRLIALREHGLEQVRVDRDGTKLVRVTGDDLQEKGHYPYVFDTARLAAGEVYLSRIAINHERGTHADLKIPTVQLAMPVVGSAGTVLGVVVVNVNLNGTFAQLAADLPKDVQFFLANGDGDYLLHPDPAQAFGFDRGRRSLVQEQFPATAELVARRSDQVLFEARDGAYAERPVVAAFISRKVAAASMETHLVLGLTQPLSSVLEKVDELGVITLRIGLVLCVVCVSLAVLLARAVTRPLGSLTQAVEHFADGQRSTGLPIERTDEIGVLARRFYRMRKQIQQQIAELNCRRVEMENLARSDPLTGLANRRLLVNRAEHALSVARRDSQRLAVLFIDLDRFKPINDNLGHAVGDLLLKAVAERIRAVIRESDTPARIGGDEFVVLLETIQDDIDAQTVAEKIRIALNLPFDIEAHRIAVSACIGIAFYPEDGTEMAELWRHADEAMYRAKENGRNAVAFYNLSG
ncbi:MAG: diguanylate cyclase [Propionivibrio sp.]